MLLFIIISVLAIISVGLAVHSLRNLSKMKEVTEAQKELIKGKVIFHSDSVSSSSSSE